MKYTPILNLIGRLVKAQNNTCIACVYKSAICDMMEVSCVIAVCDVLSRNLVKPCCNSCCVSVKDRTHDTGNGNR